MSIAPEPAAQGKHPTAQRVEHVRRIIAAEASRLLDVPPNARLLYVYGCLLADDTGRLSKAQLDPPWDRLTQLTAQTICAEFNLLGIDN